MMPAATAPPLVPEPPLWPTSVMLRDCVGVMDGVRVGVVGLDGAAGVRVPLRVAVLLLVIDTDAVLLGDTLGAG